MITHEAILLTKDNLSTVAATLNDYSAEDVLAEADHLFTLNGSVVLCASVLEQGSRLVSYIVHESLYKINNSNFADLNDKTFTLVNPI